MARPLITNLVLTNQPTSVYYFFLYFVYVLYIWFYSGILFYLAVLDYSQSRHQVDEVTASHAQMDKDIKRNRFNVRYLISSSIINFGVNCGILPWLDSVKKTATDEFPVTKLKSLIFTQLFFNYHV